MKKAVVLLLFFASMLLFGCMEREEGLDKWMPAGSSVQPNIDLFNTPSPHASAAATPSGQAGVTPSPGASPAATPSHAPSPSPSPQPTANCTVVASGSGLYKTVQVRFSIDTTATVKCHPNAAPQSTELTLSAAGTYNAFVDCTYSQAGTFLISATGGGASCNKTITVAA